MTLAAQIIVQKIKDRELSLDDVKNWAEYEEIKKAVEKEF